MPDSLISNHTAYVASLRGCPPSPDRLSALAGMRNLQAWGVSLVAQTGLQFDLHSAQGKLIASLMAALAEFERDLLRERVRSGIAAARKRGVVFGRRPGQRVKADRFSARVLKLVSEKQSYREISHRLGLSKNTVMDIVKRDRVA